MLDFITITVLIIILIVLIYIANQLRYLLSMIDSMYAMIIKKLKELVEK